MFLHGDLQTLYTGYLLALFLPLAIDPPSLRHLWKSSLKLAAAGLTMAALMAVQLFPSMVTLMESDRLALSSEERLTHSLTPSAWLDFVNPWVQGSATFSQDFIASKYVGLLTLVVAAAALILCVRRKDSNRRITLFFGIITLTALLLALGKHVPLLEPLTHVLPGLEIFRYPQKWLGLFACSISILAALGISGVRLKQRGWVVGLAALIVIELMVAMNSFLSNRLVEDRAYSTRNSLNPSQHVEGFTPQDRLLHLPTNGMMSGLMADSVTGDLEQFDEQQTRTRLIAWNLHTLLGNSASTGQLRRVSGITTFRYQGVERLWQIAIERGQVARAVDLFAARWIVTSEDHLATARRRQDIPGVIPDLAAVGWETPYAQMAFLERPTALPRALVVEAVVGVENQETTLETLFAPEWDPHRLGVVYGTENIETLGPLLQSPREPVPGTAPAGRVRFLEDETSRVVIEVEQVPSPGGLLILNDTYDSGWQAWVNGEKTPVFRTKSVRVCTREAFGFPLGTAKSVSFTSPLQSGGDSFAACWRCACRCCW